jgi:hypothetical protein
MIFRLIWFIAIWVIAMNNPVYQHPNRDVRIAAEFLRECLWQEVESVRVRKLK